MGLSAAAAAAAATAAASTKATDDSKISEIIMEVDSVILNTQDYSHNQHISGK